VQNPKGKSEAQCTPLLIIERLNKPAIVYPIGLSYFLAGYFSETILIALTKVDICPDGKASYFGFWF
jgi:hypothetical protein